MSSSPVAAAVVIMVMMMISMTADVAQGRLHIRFPPWTCNWCPWRRVRPSAPPPKLISVGAKSKGWGSSTAQELLDWSANLPKIFINDTLQFQYDRNSHNVIQLYYQEHYENCVTGSSSPTWTDGVNYIQLNHTGVHYFVCGFTCKSGMKIMVTVYDFYS